jgi:hypothetical protein
MKRKSINYLILGALLTTALPSFSSSKTFYSIAKAEAFETTESGEYYIQVGNFINQINATKLEKHVQTSIHFPVAIHRSEDRYIVIVGPMHHAEEVRDASKQLSSTLTHTQEENKQQIFEPIEFKDTSIRPLDKDMSINSNAHPWFVGLGVGAQQLNVINPMLIKNGSTYPYPNNYDQYGTQTNAQAVIAAEAGYRWKQNQKWFPSYAASLYYDHLFTTNIGRDITQYSIPSFKNYIYAWNVSSDVLLALGKLNIINYEQISPFIQAGIGLGLNHASGFNETALPDVTERISPAFSDNTSTSFAYNIGAGVDWNINEHFALSVSYQFQDMGNVSSGNGATTWSADSLKTTTYQTNLALLKINYFY